LQQGSAGVSPASVLAQKALTIDARTKAGETPALHHWTSNAAVVLASLLIALISRLYNQDDAHHNPISEHFRQSALCDLWDRNKPEALCSVGRHPASRWTAPFAGSYYLLYGIYLETGVGFRASAVWIDGNNLRDINRGEL
jgi:hypothetical protein